MNGTETNNQAADTPFQSFLGINAMDIDDDDICSRAAVRAVQILTSDIADSGICPFNLAINLFSFEALEERVYLSITDHYSGKTEYQRRVLILEYIRQKVKHSPSHFSKFLAALQGSGGCEFTERLKRTYQGNLTTGTIQ